MSDMIALVSAAAFVIDIAAMMCWLD